MHLQVDDFELMQVRAHEKYESMVGEGRVPWFWRS